MGPLGFVFSRATMMTIADLPSQPQEYIGDRIVNAFTDDRLEHNSGMK